MKIAVSSAGSTLDSFVEQRFGRCTYFIVYDTETEESVVFDNTVPVNMSGGAGIQTAQNIVDQDVSVVLTGHCGPKAFRVLAESGVKVYPVESCNIADALKLYETGRLKSLSSPDVRGHWA